LGDSISLAQLFQRPKVQIDLIQRLLPSEIRLSISLKDLETALADLIYHGYVNAQRNTNERLNQHDSLRVPAEFDFRDISGLSHEMVERLERAKPQTFGQARRLPGMTPAALSILLVRLNMRSAA
jgi:tRNA uridine 5-carboxymethylaminomethyl modification enzyme